MGFGGCVVFGVFVRKVYVSCDGGVSCDMVGGFLMSDLEFAGLDDFIACACAGSGEDA